MGSALQDSSTVRASISLQKESKEGYEDGKTGQTTGVFQPSKAEIKRFRLRIWKNVATVSLSFVCLFTAYGVVGSLQSTINSEGGLGTIAEATIYATQLLSSLFLPAWMIKKMKLKWTMVVSQLSYSIYVAAQFYPSFYTLIPAAILIGLGAAPLWTAHSVYFTQAGEKYAEVAGDAISTEVYVSRLFGVFFMITSTSSIWGQLINSAVLSTGVTNATEITDERLSYCGANFCNDAWNNFTDGPDDSTADERPANLETLLGILLGFSLLAAIVMAVLLDPPMKTSKEEAGQSTLHAVLATFRLMRDPYVLLLIPLTFFSGLKSTFLFAEFTYAFIACSWGVEHIGYVMICLGAANSFGSLLWGLLVKLTGRLPIFLFGFIVNISLIVTMAFYWLPDPDHLELVFIIAALNGLADSVWRTPLTSLYGIIFRDKKAAAFSNFRLWNSLGMTIAFAYSTLLCVDIKLYILLGTLLAGMIGYLNVEILERKRSNRHTDLKK